MSGASLGKGDANQGEKPRRPRRIVLTGAYGARNKGDAAMELTAAHELAARFGPDIEVTILAPFARDDRAFYNPVPVAACKRRQLILGTLDVMLLWAAKRLKLRSILRGNAMSGARLVIDLSGDMLSEAHGLALAYSHYIPLLRALALKKPYVICAQSIGPFKSSTPLARYILNRAAAITVRDEISFAYLKDIGVHKPVVAQTADIAFLMRSAGDQRAIELDPGRESAAPIIAVALSRPVADRYDRRANQPGAFLKVAAENLAALARRAGARLLFTPFTTGPGASRDDRNIARALAAMMPDDVRADVVDDDLRPEELKALIARAEMLVGSRMQAHIAALSSGVPVAAIASAERMAAVMGACGVADCTLNIDLMTADSMAAALTRVWDERAHYRDKLNVTIPPQRLAALQNINVIESVMKGGVARALNAVSKAPKSRAARLGPPPKRGIR